MTLDNLAIYQADSGAIELSVDIDDETIWATQRQIATLFEVTPQNITMHLKAIYADGEMDRRATCKDSLQVQIEGGRRVERVDGFAINPARIEHNKSQFLRVSEGMRLLVSEKDKLVGLVLLMLGVSSRVKAVA